MRLEKERKIMRALMKKYKEQNITAGAFAQILKRSNIRGARK